MSKLIWLACNVAAVVLIVASCGTLYPYFAN